MMALRAHSRGGPEKLVYERAPRPVPAAGEVLVEVRAAAITFAELGWDLSWTRLDGSDRTPVIPAREVSGVVAELGPGVRGLAAGDQVYGLIDFDRDGAAAEYATVWAGDLAPRPRTVDDARAAALPLAALTAFQALVEHAVLAPGERVLVLGGAGGVGVYGVQIAACLGARVTATDAAGHAALVRSLGAEDFFDHTTADLERSGAAFDVVLDTVGGAALERAYPLVRPGGRLVTLSAQPPAEVTDRYGIVAIFFVARPDRDQLAYLARLVDEGGLRPVVARAFPLAEGRAAFESGRLPRRPGKTVLLVS
ncbi:NADP-dependent oxidoreductase [Frankia sp. CNm7]|nr:NADP-dependent oxidoreductase [Frankia nepalensis]MBL7513045.1 NADP-dependent oxidoreductase [Frankia nepalensis]MBL7523812.1 NADP-dependent oxidoreductase [Frankia nepalensis]